MHSGRLLNERTIQLELFPKICDWLMTIFWPFLSNHFFANYMNIFHKTEVQAVILRCWMGPYFNWFKSYDTKWKYFLLLFFQFCKKLVILVMFFLFFAFLRFFCICVITFKMIVWTSNFVEDIHVVGKKMARNGRKTDI